MITCRHATPWISKTLDAKLPWFKRILLSFHRGQCKSCRRFGEQLVLLEKSFVQFTESNKVPARKMSPECRTRISNYLSTNRPND